MENSSETGTDGPAAPLRAERVDYADFAQPSRALTQSLEGFDPDYRDIVDYILRCTHRIWEERDVGLIYSHYTHNCVVHTPLGTTYDRESVVESTIGRIATMPDRGMATQVIWHGDDQKGFYTSHLVTSAGHHTRLGPYGPPTGRAFATRTIADCLVWRNRIYREWLVGDSMAVVRQLGLDPLPIAEARARALHERGQVVLDLGQSPRVPGQLPPEPGPTGRLADTSAGAWALDRLHEGLNERMFGRLLQAYAPEVSVHGPLMSEVTGAEAALGQWIGLLGAIPDGSFLPLHACSVPQPEGGDKIALRWILEGHHRGWGHLETLGAPTGLPLRLMGMTHFHVVDGHILEEWTVYDEMSLLVQLRLGAMRAGNRYG